LWVFKTLMSFRAAQLAPQFVQALNLIDVEFTSPKEKDVRDAWKVLLDHFTEWGRKAGPQSPQDVKTDAEEATRLGTELLWSMAKSLGYDFDKVYLKKGAYYPQGLGNVEQEQHALRKGVLNLLAGQSKLPVAVFEQRFAEITANPEPAIRNAVAKDEF